MKTEKLVVIAGYRGWALRVLENLQEHNDSDIYIHAKTPQALEKVLASSRVDVVYLVGWSWIIPSDQLENHFVLGLHPSNLPDFAGGSPLQHQIIAGLKKTKMTLFEITPKLDQGRILFRTDLSLEGHMVDIFESMIVAGTKLIRKSLAELDSPLTIPWEANTAPTGTVKLRKRLQPENSEIKKEQFTQYSLQHIYNLIRARENPYPNAYIEDTTGRLYIRKVDFEPKT